MRPRFWQLTTLLSTLGAAYLALFPLPRKQPPDRPGKPVSSGQASRPAPGTNEAGLTPIEQLRAAKTSVATCRALAALPPGSEPMEAARERLRDPQVMVRRCAALALVRLGQAGGPGTEVNLAELKERAADADTQVRQAALDGLSRSDLPGAREWVYELASSPKLPAARRHEAMYALASAGRAEVIPLLAAEVERNSGQVRRRMVSALGQTKRPEAAAVLGALAGKAGGSWRREIYYALGQLGGEVALAVLKKALLEGGRDETQTAAHALAQIDDAEAREILFLAALRPERLVARAAMGALAGLEGSDVRELMLEQLRSQDEEMVSAACRYFASHPDETVAAQLVEVARRESRYASGPAVHALGRLGGETAKKALLALAGKPGIAQSSALSQLSQWPDAGPEVRGLLLKIVAEGGSSAQRVLWHLEEDGSDEARGALIGALKGGGHLASNAAHYLARSGTPEAVKALTDAALRSDNPQLRQNALSALGQSGDRSAVETLSQALKDPDQAIRSGALGPLANLGGPEAERLVREAASGTDVALRSASIHALAQLNTPESRQQLRELVSDENKGIARSALGALASTDPVAAAGTITELMRSDDVEKRRAAVETVSYLEGDRSRTVLLEAVRDSDPGIAATAARSLGRQGGPEVRAALEQLLVDGRADRQARLAAADALEQLGGDGASHNKEAIAQVRQPPPAPVPQPE